VYVSKVSRYSLTSQVLDLNFVSFLSSFLHTPTGGLEVESAMMRLITKKGEKGKLDRREMCNFFALRHPHRALALLIEGCLKAGSFVPASSFSNHSDKKMIFPFGCDRGGDSTTMLV
jgi:hypothetical protein